MDPILSTSIVSSLLTSLNPADASARLVLETLRTLNAIADALSLALPASGFHDGSLSDTLFSSTHVDGFRKVLSQTSAKPLVQQQISLAAGLVAKTCRDERHRSTLARMGILGALGARLAAFVVAMGCVLIRPDHERHDSTGFERIPRSAPPTAELYPILDAVASIIHGSKFRASQLLYGPEMMAVLPVGIHTMPGPTRTKADISTKPVKTSSAPRPSAIDYILPRTPNAYHLVSSTQAHPFSSPTSSSASQSTVNGHSRPSLDRHRSDVGLNGRGGDEDESPFIPWLIALARCESGVNRLIALSVLAELSRIGLVGRSREGLLGLVVVPLLVRMSDDLSTRTSAYPPGNDPEWVRQTVRERGPAILAMLVTDSGELQRAAVEADAIKRLAEMLKGAYHPATDLQQRSLWTPHLDLDQLDGTHTRRELRLGDPGLSPRLIHKLRVRESTLQALAALAPFRDEHRKMIIDAGVAPFLLESLKPYEETALSPSNPAAYGSALAKIMRSSSALIGNPVSVLVAACALVRALSRSVSILRTSLIDAGIALPLFTLLTSPDIEVQISATAVVCNLVLEFSPMREVSLCNEVSL